MIENEKINLYPELEDLGQIGKVFKSFDKSGIDVNLGREIVSVLTHRFLVGDKDSGYRLGVEKDAFDLHVLSMSVALGYESRRDLGLGGPRYLDKTDAENLKLIEDIGASLLNPIGVLSKLLNSELVINLKPEDMSKFKYEVGRELKRSRNLWLDWEHGTQELAGIVFGVTKEKDLELLKEKMANNLDLLSDILKYPADKETGITPLRSGGRIYEIPDGMSEKDMTSVADLQKLQNELVGLTFAAPTIGALSGVAFGVIANLIPVNIENRILDTLIEVGLHKIIPGLYLTGAVGWPAISYLFKELHVEKAKNYAQAVNEDDTYSRQFAFKAPSRKLFRY